VMLFLLRMDSYRTPFSLFPQLAYAYSERGQGCPGMQPSLLTSPAQHIPFHSTIISIGVPHSGTT